MRDFYDGWKPRAIKAEPPKPEQLAKFLNIVKNMKPWAAGFWINEISKTHSDRTAEAYRRVINSLTLKKANSPYHMTAMLTQEELRAFSLLYVYNDKDILFCGGAILCLRERFMLASTIFQSLS